MRLHPSCRPSRIRPPIMEPVTTLPGLPAIPGEVRHPVPALSIRRIQHQGATR